jgi:ADP-heptose:LPS heptosyltransferase
VLATHWLGDTFWALQVVPFLREAHPGARLHVLVRPGLAWLARLWCGEAEVHELPGLVSDRRREGLPRPWRIVGAARRWRAVHGSPDLLIDLTLTPAAALCAWVLRPGSAVGAGARRFARRAFDDWRPLAEFRGHLALRPWWILESRYGDAPSWPPEVVRLRPRLPVTPPAPGPRDPVLLFPGAGWPQKRWPLDRFVELAARIEREGREVRLLFAPGEEALAGEAARILPSRVTVTAGHDMFGQLMRARAVVANDSGPAHLAAALGLPTVALFGPTHPAVCGPLGDRVTVLRTDCPERPGEGEHHCHGRPAYACERGCLATIGVASVHQALNALPEQPQTAS